MSSSYSFDVAKWGSRDSSTESPSDMDNNHTRTSRFVRRSDHSSDRSSSDPRYSYIPRRRSPSLERFHSRPHTVSERRREPSPAPVRPPPPAWEPRTLSITEHSSRLPRNGDYTGDRGRSRRAHGLSTGRRGRSSERQSDSISFLRNPSPSGSEASSRLFIPVSLHRRHRSRSSTRWQSWSDRSSDDDDADDEGTIISAKSRSRTPDRRYRSDRSSGLDCGRYLEPPIPAPSSRSAGQSSVTSFHDRLLGDRRHEDNSRNGSQNTSLSASVPIRQTPTVAQAETAPSVFTGAPNICISDAQCLTAENHIASKSGLPLEIDLTHEGPPGGTSRSVSLLAMDSQRGRESLGQHGRTSSAQSSTEPAAEVTGLPKPATAGSSQKVTAHSKSAIDVRADAPVVAPSILCTANKAKKVVVPTALAHRKGPSTANHSVSRLTQSSSAENRLPNHPPVAGAPAQRDSASPVPSTRSATPNLTSDSGIDSLTGNRDSNTRDSTDTVESLPGNDTLPGSDVRISPSVASSPAKSVTMSPVRSAKRPHSSAAFAPPAVKPAAIARTVRSTTEEPRRSVLLEHQMGAVNFFRDVELVARDPVIDAELKIAEPMEVENTLVNDSLEGTRQTRRNRTESTERTDSFTENRSMTTLEVAPMKKFSLVDLGEMDILAKKRRYSEVMLPDYKNLEPKRFRGMFHAKLLIEFQKQHSQMRKAEKKRTIPPFGRITQTDVINILRNIETPADLADPILQQIALYAVLHHRRQENYLVIIMLLAANGFDFNITNDEGDSLLKLALKTDDLCLMDILLKLPKLELTNLDKDGNSALHVAAQLWLEHPEKWSVVELILESPEAVKSTLLFAKNKAMRTAFSVCLTEGFTKKEMEDFVMAFGAANIAQHSESLLHLLANHRRIDLLIFCLSHFYFDPDRVDSDGRTILHILAAIPTLSKDDADALTEMIRTLRASLTITDKKDRTAIFIAQSCGNSELVRLWNDAVRESVAVLDKPPGQIVKDISLGKEPHPVRVFNDKSTKRMDDFVYIRQNIYLGDSPRIKGMLSCGCRPGGCNTVTCSCLKRGLGYSASGTIVPGTCKGNPIFECGPQCACGPSCSSRVVQRGIRIQLEIFMTTKRGWGVRAPRTVQPGEFICEFVGEIVESDRLLSRDPDNDWAMELTVDDYDGTMFHVDPTTCGNVARFLNHSCDPNLFPVRVYQSGEAVDTGVVMAMFSAQVIQKNHELTFHYGDAYWQRQNDLGVYCSCGTSKCKFAAPKKLASKKRPRS